LLNKCLELAGVCHYQIHKQQYLYTD